MLTHLSQEISQGRLPVPATLSLVLALLGLRLARGGEGGRHGAGDEDASRTGMLMYASCPESGAGSADGSGSPACSLSILSTVPSPVKMWAMVRTAGLPTRPDWGRRTSSAACGIVSSTRSILAHPICARCPLPFLDRWRPVPSSVPRVQQCGLLYRPGGTRLGDRRTRGTWRMDAGHTCLQHPPTVTAVGYGCRLLVRTRVNVPTHSEPINDGRTVPVHVCTSGD